MCMIYLKTSIKCLFLNTTWGVPNKIKFLLHNIKKVEHQIYLPFSFLLFITFFLFVLFLSISLFLFICRRMCLTDRSVIIPATQIRVCAVDVFSFISALACGFECALLSLLLDSPWTWLAVWESDVWTEQLNTERVNSVGELSFKCVWILILDNTPIIQTLVSFSIWNSLSSMWVELFDSYHTIFELESCFCFLHHLIKCELKMWQR